MEPQADERVAAAIADLAARLGVDPSQVTVTSHEPVTWSDGSLGCPAPGMLYTQALVPGVRLVLDVAGDAYEFHAAVGGPFRWCPDPVPPAGPGRAVR